MEGENIGFCPSFFELLYMASEGDYWAFCDQDDYWYPDIPLLYHSGIALGDDSLSVKKKYENPFPDFDFQKSITSNIFYGFAFVVNRAMYDKLVQVNPARIKYHDWFMAMIVTAFGKWHFSGEIQAVHRMNVGCDCFFGHNSLYWNY